MVVSVIAEQLGSQDEKRGPDSFSSLVEEVGIDFLDESVGRPGELLKLFLDQGELGLDVSIKFLKAWALGDQPPEGQGRHAGHR
jgi:hypothetical protein